MSLRRLLEPLAADAPAVRAGALALLCTYAFFVGAPAWNQNSRFSLTRALVEDQSVRIDRFHETTGDKAFREPHWYTDKAPGTSWLAAPAYAVFYTARRVTGGELPSVRVRSLDRRLDAAGRSPTPAERLPGDRLVYNNAHRVALWLCTLFAVGSLAVLGSLAAYLLAWHRTGDRKVARRVALALGLATPVLPYATSLYGHAPCGALLLIALAIIVLDRGSRGLAIAAGACAGVAVTAEYPAALPAALLWALGLRRQGSRFAGFMLVGAAAPALLLAAYHTAAFGHPLRTGYDFVVGDEFSAGMAVRYGIGLPRATVVLEILFGSYRGLFHLSPVLLLAAWGLVHDAVRGEGQRRTIAAVALAICVYYVLLNAGYYMWDGGASAGPRHIVPMLGFLALGLPAAMLRVPKAFVVLAVVSAAQMLLLAAATPEAPRWGDPIWEYAMGAVFAHDAGPGGSATNLGRLLGLPGALSLLPLVAPWAWARAVAGDADQNRPEKDKPVVRPS